MGTFPQNAIKKTTITIAFLFMVIGNAHSQMGCTDNFANNYNTTAIQNDGSCTYDSVMISAENSYPLDEVLSETSGLIYWDDTLWTHNDDGDIILYRINPFDGSIAGNVSLYPQTNEDWEGISQDEDYIYVGDFGNNNNGKRTNLKIIRVSKKSILYGTPEMDVINFAYADQTDFTPQGPNNTNYDCEAFIVTETAIYLFTKEWISQNTRIYKLPKTPGTYLAEFQDGHDIKGMVTGAVYKKERGIIVLSGYNILLQPFIFLLYDFENEDFFGGNKRKLNLNLPFHQVESITTKDGFNFFITNERFDTTRTPQQMHTLDLAPYLKE